MAMALMRSPSLLGAAVRALTPLTLRAPPRASPALFSSSSSSSMQGKLVAPPMVYAKGEEMTRYVMSLILDKWIEPHLDTTSWQYFDLSCKARDDTDDEVLRECVRAGANVKSIFKEPTITPTEEQVKSLGLTKRLPSPNGAMRRGWNGITISRGTIHIPGVKLGYDKPVIFERHAVGGEYSAGYKTNVGRGTLRTVFYPEVHEPGNPSLPPYKVVYETPLTDGDNAVVTYHNPLDNVSDLAEIFFNRCLEAKVTPYVVTKKTVFKWQESFWQIHKRVFDAKYRGRFLAAGLLGPTNGELAHLISDAATMKIAQWKQGNFGMSAHNYDGDMLTDEISQVHRSPGFVSSELVGKSSRDGSLIKEFEASHGTVTDMDQLRLDGRRTSFNPLGLSEALFSAIIWADQLAGVQPLAEDADVDGPAAAADTPSLFAARAKSALRRVIARGQATSDLAGAGKGLSTEEFIDAVADELKCSAEEGNAAYWASVMEASSSAAELEEDETSEALRDSLVGELERAASMAEATGDRGLSGMDSEAVVNTFLEWDADGDGRIGIADFARAVKSDKK
ncbi:isocitrate dehydrogenase [Pycnococcus provasolii]